MSTRTPVRCTIFLTYALILRASSASPASCVVRPDGSRDFPTIQAAIDARVAGDEIESTDGVFTGKHSRDISFTV